MPGFATRASWALAVDQEYRLREGITQAELRNNVKSQRRPEPKSTGTGRGQRLDRRLAGLGGIFQPFGRLSLLDDRC